MKIGDLVKWTIPDEDGTMIDHLGIVLKYNSNIKRKSHGKPRPSVNVYLNDLNIADWFFVDELEMVSESR